MTLWLFIYRFIKEREVKNCIIECAVCKLFLRLLLCMQYIENAFHPVHCFLQSCFWLVTFWSCIFVVSNYVCVRRCFVQWPWWCLTMQWLPKSVYTRAASSTRGLWRWRSSPLIVSVRNNCLLSLTTTMACAQSSPFSRLPAISRYSSSKYRSRSGHLPQRRWLHDSWPAAVYSLKSDIWSIHLCQQ